MTEIYEDDRVAPGFWSKVRLTLRKVPFVPDAIALYLAAVDPKTPATAKAIALGALAYFIAPVDVIPDFIAGLGYTDDAAVLIAAIKAMGGHITDRHRERANELLTAEVLPPTDKSKTTKP